MRALIMLNYLRYWPFTLACLTIAIKEFRYSSLFCAKFDLLGSKLVLSDSTLNVMLIQLSFIATPKIKQLFFVNFLLFMIFIVLVVMPITLIKQKERYMKGQLNMFELVITVLLTNISTIAQVLNICLTLRLSIRNCLRHITYSK